MSEPTSAGKPVYLNVDEHGRATAANEKAIQEFMDKMEKEEAMAERLAAMPTERELLTDIAASLRRIAKAAERAYPAPTPKPKEKAPTLKVRFRDQYGRTEELDIVDAIRKMQEPL